MANIMITEKCNLNCSYCFANEFVNKVPREMSLENFRTALDFAMSSGDSERIGIIGGEPTLHSEFRWILQTLIYDSRIKHVVVFTNALEIDRYLNEIAHPKIYLLVNCNSPAAIGEIKFSSLISNIDTLIAERYMKDRVTLGINMHKPDFEYDYMIDLLKTFEMKDVRVSITVPNINSFRNADSVEYFRMMKPRVKEFFYALLNIGVLPHFDCNQMPPCLIEHEEKEQLAKIIGTSFKNNIAGDCVACAPVIDILPNLKAVRCFGLSEYAKVDIKDYKTIQELRNYFLRIFDAYAFNTSSSTNCYTCHSRDTMKCNGGCLAYKISDILKMQSYSERLMELKQMGGIV